MLSNRNFIAESLQLAAWAYIKEGDSIIAILPIFHGFGLGGCVNAFLTAGAKTILVPVFNAKNVGKLVQRKRPTLLAGPPALYDALTKERSFRRADLSCLRATVCGADTLPRPLPDPVSGERVKAYVVLKDVSRENAETERALIEHCHKQLIKWSCPREIEFRRSSTNAHRKD